MPADVTLYRWHISLSMQNLNQSCICSTSTNLFMFYAVIRIITKLPNSEQSYKGKVNTHNYINRQNQSTTGKL